MCCAGFIAKYVLFITNLVFSLLGLAVVGIGIAVLIAIKDLTEILPVNLIPISLIILGAVVFLISFLACCGAITESRCMLISYSILVLIVTAFFIYLTVVIFSHLSTIEETVDQWIVTAFNNNDLRTAFNVMEVAFRCCGTTGAASYIAINATLPTTCCPNPSSDVNICVEADAYRGCGDMVGGWLASFSAAVGILLLAIIIVQVVAIIFALFLSNTISNKRRRIVY